MFCTSFSSSEMDEDDFVRFLNVVSFLQPLMNSVTRQATFTKAAPWSDMAVSEVSKALILLHSLSVLTCLNKRQHTRAEMVAVTSKVLPVSFPKTARTFIAY